jgi:casein kinase II subunit alpha
VKLRTQSPRDGRQTPPEPADRDDDDNQSFSYLFSNIDDYMIGHRVGCGRYNNVFQGHDKISNTCLIKALKPVRASKIRREIRILEHLHGGPHIAQLLHVVQDPDRKSIALILDRPENQNVRTIVN